MRNSDKKKMAAKALTMVLAMALTLSTMSTPVQAAAGPQCVMECPSPTAGLLDRLIAMLGLR